jgi:hypothetical protein
VFFDWMIVTCPRSPLNANEFHQTAVYRRIDGIGGLIEADHQTNIEYFHTHAVTDKTRRII